MAKKIFYTPQAARVAGKDGIEVSFQEEMLKSEPADYGSYYVIRNVITMSAVMRRWQMMCLKCLWRSQLN
jgi:hypothetical protein